MQEEEREKGRVGFWVYWNYLILAYRGALVPFVLLAQILFQILQIASNYWMAWAAPVSKDVEPTVSMSTLLYVYVALALGSSLCILVRSLFLTTVAYKTATLLFNKMHMSIFRAPMSFFDSTPSGRILNRASHLHRIKFHKFNLFAWSILSPNTWIWNLQASTDQSEVDTNIADQMGSVAFSIIQLVGIVAVMSQVAWQVFVVFIPVFVACVWYQVPFAHSYPLACKAAGSPISHCTCLCAEILHRYIQGAAKASRSLQSSYHTAFCRINNRINYH